MNNYGQYFTTNIVLLDKIYDFILNKPTSILEPSIGQGDIVKYISKKIPNIIFDMYEIDSNIILLDDVKKENVIYGDFIKQTIKKTYDTIVANPPYIRTKNGNLYIDFTEKCYNLLTNNGELIFIVPSDFLKLTSSSKLLNMMIMNGTFTHIFHPHDEHMFKDATIDIIIFRYCKNKLLEKKVLYNDKLLYITNHNGLITFNENINTNSYVFEDIFDIYVGMVTGKEEVFKNDKIGNIEVLNGYNKFEKYIFIENFPSKNNDINNYLLEHKKDLIERKIRKFNENNWFEWGAPRNINSINKNNNKDCIYIYTLTRKTNVAFIGKVCYFGGGLIMLVPKKQYNLEKILLYLNSNIFTNNFIFSGRFKIGHRQISNSYIPTEYLLLNNNLQSIELQNNNLENNNLQSNNLTNTCIKIQKWFRGCIVRLKRLPLIMYKIQKFLQSQTIILSNENKDGRVNSTLDEDIIIKLLINKFNTKIKCPKYRMWYDILAFDYRHGWIPINIKTTTTLTKDNTGNLAMCVYAYTDENLDIHKQQTYTNGKMSNILFTKLKSKKYNMNNKKDYYFLVLNKTNKNDIIINSIKGLSVLTPNINNLPFQICWDKNRIYKYENIIKKVKLFIDCLQKPTPSWKETFMTNIRKL